jgi:hypothetical protein
MRIITIKKVILNFVSLLLFSACANVEPYIYNPDEYNRESPNFSKEIIDRSEVIICYNKSSTTPEILIQMATDECGRFGKVANFIKHDHFICSISSPAQAIFQCSCPDVTGENRSKNGQISPKKSNRSGC